MGSSSPHDAGADAVRMGRRRQRHRVLPPQDGAQEEGGGEGAGEVAACGGRRDGASVPAAQPGGHEEEDEEEAQEEASEKLLCPRCSHVENWTFFHEPFVPALSCSVFCAWLGSSVDTVCAWLGSTVVTVMRQRFWNNFFFACVKVDCGSCGPFAVSRGCRKVQVIGFFWVLQEGSMFSEVLGSTSETVHTSVNGALGRISILVLREGGLGILGSILALVPYLHDA